MSHNLGPVLCSGSIMPTGTPWGSGTGPPCQSVRPSGHVANVRSRSPQNLASTNISSNEVWRHCDRSIFIWYESNIISQKLREDLKKEQDVSTSCLSRWAITAMQKQVHTPEAWIHACLGRVRTARELRDLRGSGLVQQAGDMAPQDFTTPASPMLQSGGQADGQWGTVPVQSSINPSASVAATCVQVMNQQTPTTERFALSQGSPGRMPSDGERTPPDWAVSLIQSAQTDKRAFLTGFMKQLINEADVEAFMEMSPEMQVHMAWALLHIPASWSNVTGTFRQMIYVHKKFDKPPAALQSTKQSITIKPIFLCSGSGTGMVAFMRAVEIVRAQRTDVRIAIAGTWCFEIDERATKVEQQVAKNLNVDIHQCGNVEQWLEIVQVNAPEWRSQDFILASLTSAPCTCISGANSSLNALKNGGSGGLHTAPTNLIHACYAGDHAALQALGPTRFAHFMEFPPCSNQAEESVVTAMYGAPHQIASHTNYNLAKRNRMVRCSPMVDDMAVKKYGTIWNPEEIFPDGSRWMGNSAPAASFPDVILRPYIIKLMDQTFQGDLLKEYEATTLKNIKSRQPCLEERYVPIHAWFRWLGHDPDGPLASAMKQLHPCHQFIYPSTGTQAPLTSSAGLPCGKVAYCENCCAICEMLSYGWEAQSFTDYLCQWLHQIIAAKVDGKPVAQYPLDKEHVHQCGPECPLGLRRCWAQPLGA